MLAFALTGFDAPARFLDVPAPEPGPDEIVVRVHATSVNQVDRLVRSGFFRQGQEYRFPAVLGRDLAGVVHRVGPRVTRFVPGDRVYGFVKREHVGQGTFAEYVAFGQDLFVGPAPTTTTLAQAGVLPLAGITALECVDAVAAGSNGVVVVNGAAGGVGVFAVQLAVAAGAEVIATAGTADQLALVRALGAAHVLDRAAGDLVDQVRALAPDGVDGFVDLATHVRSSRMGVGEAEAHETFARLCRGLLRKGGRASSVTNGGVPELLGDIEYTNVHSTPSPASFARLTRLVDTGAVVVPISDTFAFGELDAAFDRLAAGPAHGKIAVVLAQEPTG